jgi:hypothetical protein
MIHGAKKKEHLAIIIIIKKRMRNYKKKEKIYLLEPNCLQYLSKDGTLIIHYQNGISMSF